MAGYSGTPLLRKLGVKPGFRACAIQAPDGYATMLGPLPDGVRLLARPGRDMDLIHLFVKRRADLERRLATLRTRIHPAGMLWISWPKKSSGVVSDLSEDVLREVVLPTGLVDVKVCAVDETWSALKFVVRKELRANWPQAEG